MNKNTTIPATATSMASKLWRVVNRRERLRTEFTGRLFVLTFAMLALFGYVGNQSAFADSVSSSEMAATFFGEADSTAQAPTFDPLVPQYYADGYVTTTKGVPLERVWMRIVLYYGGETYVDLFRADTTGYYRYSAGIPLYSQVRIGPDHGHYPYLYDENPRRVSPDSVEVLRVEQDLHQDYSIQPSVVMNMDCSSWRPSNNGVKAVSGGVTVAEWDGSTVYCAKKFYPDDFYLPHTGWIYYSKPFHKFWPQTIGVFHEYDCHAKMVDSSTPGGGILIEKDLEPDATFSWNDPGGIGWDRFIVTPDNRFPNSPNVYVEVDFDLSADWPKEHIRLRAGQEIHYAMEDLTSANGYLARFMYPNTSCSRDDYLIEIYYQTGSGTAEWTALTEHRVTGTTNGDLTADNQINLADVSAFNLTLGSCEGDSNFVPCANYSPDDCINLSDVPFFSLIYFGGQDKEHVTNAGGTVWFEEGVNGEKVCMFSAFSDWDVALIQFESGIAESMVDLWTPASPLTDRSVLVPRDEGEDGEFALWVFGSGSAGEIELGTILPGDAKGLETVQVRGVETVARDVVNNGQAILPSTAVRLGYANPNPFNPMTAISYEVPASMPVSLIIYDVSGRAVRTLLDRELVDAGRSEVVWNGRDDSGLPVAGGVYLYRLSAGDFTASRRMTLLK